MALKSHIANYTDSAILNIVKYKNNESKYTFKSDAQTVDDYISDINNYLDEQLPILFSNPNVIDYIFYRENLDDDSMMDAFNEIYNVLFSVFPVVDTSNYAYSSNLTNEAENYYIDFLREAYNIYSEEVEKEIIDQSELFKPLANIAGKYVA